MAKKIKSLMVLLVFVSCFIIAGSVNAIAASSGSENIKIVRSLYALDKDHIFIPQVSGMVNHELQSKINDNLKQSILSLKNTSPDSSLWGDFEVPFYNGNLLGIHVTAISNTKQTVHPNKIDRGIHLDLTTGKIYELQDLFKADSNYENRIKELCLANEPTYRLTNKGKWANWTWDDWTYDTFVRSWTGQSFLLSGNFVRVYDSLNFATGYYSGYGVPYSDLMDIIDTEGPLWKAIQSHEAMIVAVIPEQ